MINHLLHIHTYRCKHAKGDVEDYCLQAVKKGIRAIGISDHTPLPDGRWNHVRMEMTELEDYVNKLDQAKINFPDLKIFKGAECEFDEKFIPFYKEVLLGRHKLDYLIGSAHWFPHEGKWLGIYGNMNDSKILNSYSKYLITSMESGLFLFIAHPDAFFGSYRQWDENAIACSKEIIETAKKLNIPLEINALGFFKPWVPTSSGNRPPYPFKPFWNLAAEYNIKVVISSDAHSPKDLTSGLDLVQGIATENNLEEADFSSIGIR